MSWQKLLLNPLLRLIEKRQMANAKGPSSLRRAPKLLAISAHCQRAVARAVGSVGHTAILG